MTDGWHGSSTIAAVAYSPEAQVLTVRFKDGDRVYHHHNVSQAEFDAFDKAESAGKHYAKHLKGRFGAREHGR